MPDRLAHLPEALPPIRARRSGRRLIFWGGSILLVVAIAVAGLLLPVAAWIDAFRGWIEGFGIWGIVVFALAYVLATVALIPCAPLSIVAGLAWGLWALPLVLVAAMTGSSLAFEIARRLARARVEAWAARHPRGAAVAEAVREQGWRIVLLLRLSPVVPFNMQNYLFGITGIGFVPYAVATAIGVLPGAALFIAIGAFGHGSAESDTRTLNWILFGVGLAATVGAAVLVTRTLLAKLRHLEAARGAASGSRVIATQI
jgi:uncharacterized membrane protein YdjX (TVP38/TMEM64 family)